MVAFEAAKSGLPTFTISNEEWEISHCNYLEKKYCSIYLGDRNNYSLDKINLPYDLNNFSKNGIKKLSTSGFKNIIKIIENLFDNDQ